MNQILTIIAITSLKLDSEIGVIHLLFNQEEITISSLLLKPTINYSNLVSFSVRWVYGTNRTVVMLLELS
jgi:hypothetical protein